MENWRLATDSRGRCDDRGSCRGSGCGGGRGGCRRAGRGGRRRGGRRGGRGGGRRGGRGGLDGGRGRKCSRELNIVKTVSTTVQLSTKLNMEHFSI